MSFCEWFFGKKKNKSIKIKLSPEMEASKHPPLPKNTIPPPIPGAPNVMANSRENAKLLLEAETGFELTKWTRVALNITGSFETIGDPWQQVTGDFDGMGLSAGVLQWNIGSGTLQPLIKSFIDKTDYDFFIKVLNSGKIARQLKDAAFKPRKDALRIISQWSSGAKVHEPYNTAMRALMGSGPMKDIQVEAAEKIGAWAADKAEMWHYHVNNKIQITKDPGHFKQSLHEFCFFFDVRVQNGSMKGLWLDDVGKFVAGDHIENISNADIKKTMDQILEWCLSRGDLPGARDCARNADVWSYELKIASIQTKFLFILAWLRSLKSGQQWQAVVFNRKGALALGAGYYGGELRNWRQALRLQQDVQLQKS